MHITACYHQCETLTLPQNLTLKHSLRHPKAQTSFDVGVTPAEAALGPTNTSNYILMASPCPSLSRCLLKPGLTFDKAVECQLRNSSPADEGTREEMMDITVGVIEEKKKHTCTNHAPTSP